MRLKTFVLTAILSIVPFSAAFAERTQGIPRG